MFCFPCLSIPGTHRLKLSRLPGITYRNESGHDSISASLKTGKRME